MDLSKITVASARKALDAKEFSSVELTDGYLDAIKKKALDMCRMSDAPIEVTAEKAEKK